MAADGATTPNFPVIACGERGTRLIVPNNGLIPTLPDILAPELKVVFVGINPSIYSVEHGHYFARPANRFWPAFSRSRLSAEARQRLEREELVPEDDHRLLEDGFGFTDVVKLPTASASDLRQNHFAEWAPRARSRIEHFAPAVVCFQGVTALRPFLKHAMGLDCGHPSFGRQDARLGETQIFLVPNPSPANARYRLTDLLVWFDVLAAALDG